MNEKKTKLPEEKGSPQATKEMKPASNTIGLLVMGSLVMGVVDLFFLFGTMCVGGNTTLIVLGALLVGVPLLISIFYKSFNTNMRTAFLSVLMLQMILLPGAFILMSLSMFDCSPHGPESRGWGHVHPLTPSINYRPDQSFRAAFTNDAGSPIHLVRVKVFEKLPSGRGVDCQASINGKSAEALTTSGLWVASGSAFLLEAVCSGANHKTDDKYEMNITIIYTQANGGIVTQHNETGMISYIVE